MLFFFFSNADIETTAVHLSLLISSPFHYLDICHLDSWQISVSVTHKSSLEDTILVNITFSFIYLHAHCMLIF